MNRRIRLKFISYGGILLLLTAVLVLKNRNPTLSDPENTQKPGPSRVIRVGIFDLEPLNFLDLSRQAKGLNVDILYDTVGNKDFRIEFIYGTWAEGLERLERGEIDLMPSVAYSTERDQMLDYCNEPVAELWGQVFVPLRSSIKNITDCNNRRIAVMEKDISARNFIQTAENFGMTCVIEEYPTHTAAFAAVQRGDVDAAVAPQHFGLRHAKQYRLVPSTIQFSPFAIYFATKQGAHADLLKHLDLHLADWKQDSRSIYYQRINYWLGTGGNPGFISKRILVWFGGGALLAFSIIALWVISLKLMLTRRTHALSKNRQDLQTEVTVTDSFIQCMPGYLFLCDVHGRYIRWNKNLSNWLSTTEEDMPEREITTLALESDRGKLQTAWTNCILNGNATIEISSIRNNGLKENQRLIVTLTRIEMRQKTCLIGTAVDITVRKQAETELAEAHRAVFNMMEDAVLAKQRLEITQHALDRSADAVLWIECDTTFSYANDSACRLLGYTKEELLKLSVPEIDKNFPAERMHEAFVILDQKKVLDTESALTAKDGRIIPVEIHDSLIEFGSRTFICAFIHDITTRKQMQAAIEKRIVALTRPLDDAENIAFDELFDLAEIQRIQDEFASATGVASIITLPDGAPITAPSNFTCLCNDIIRKTEKGCSNCFKSDAALGRHHPEGPVIQPCMSGGLWDAGVSITVGNRHIANWLIGQVRDETQTDAAMRIYAQEIGANEQRFMDAFYNVPVMSLEHFEKIAQALFTLANQLSTSAYQNIQQARLITEEKKNKAEMQRLSTAIEQSPEAVVITDTGGNIQYANPSFASITGYSCEEAIGNPPRILKSGQHDAAFYSNLWKTIRAGTVWKGRFINKKKNGDLYTEEASISPVRDPSGTITGYVAVKRDITEELSKDEQFRQSQKMEAIGQLAGGVAHDFNNILQAILGFSEILLNNLKAETVEFRNVSEIHKAAKRAAELTRQLLAFSRKQPIDKKRLNLNTAIYDSEVLIKLLLGDHVKCELSLHPDLKDVQADHGQITQIIMNLAVNARDAMPDGGLLTIVTENTTFETKDITAEPEAKAGRFACMSITDTGSGMTQEVKDHLFEPFFTTKMVGQGTGLGLSVVYGIVKQNKGWIHVESEVGKGTTFRIYLPLCEKNTSAINHPDNPIKARKARILLVEDDADTLNMVTRIFDTAEYETVATSSAEEALALFTQNPGRFDLLFSDISLPGETGIELADTIRSAAPGLPIILYSGYQNPREKWENLDRKGYQFIQKPFSIASLLATVHDALKDRN